MRALTTLLAIMALGLVPIIGGTWAINSVLLSFDVHSSVVTVVSVLGFLAAVAYFLVTMVNFLVAILITRGAGR